MLTDVPIDKEKANYLHYEQDLSYEMIRRKLRLDITTVCRLVTTREEWEKMKLTMNGKTIEAAPGGTLSVPPDTVETSAAPGNPLDLKTPGQASGYWVVTDGPVELIKEFVRNGGLLLVRSHLAAAGLPPGRWRLRLIKPFTCGPHTPPFSATTVVPFGVRLKLKPGNNDSSVVATLTVLRESGTAQDVFDKLNAYVLANFKTPAPSDGIAGLTRGATCAPQHSVQDIATSTRDLVEADMDADTTKLLLQAIFDSQGGGWTDQESHITAICRELGPSERPDVWRPAIRCLEDRRLIKQRLAPWRSWLLTLSGLAVIGKSDEQLADLGNVSVKAPEVAENLASSRHDPAPAVAVPVPATITTPITAPAQVETPNSRFGDLDRLALLLENIKRLKALQVAQEVKRQELAALIEEERMILKIADPEHLIAIASCLETRQREVGNG